MDTSDPTNRRRLHFFVFQFQLDVAACHVSVTEPLLHHCDIVLEKDCFIPITKNHLPYWYLVMRSSFLFGAHLQKQIKAIPKNE